MRTVDDVIADLRVKHSGRTMREGRQPADDELLLAEINRLRGESKPPPRISRLHLSPAMLTTLRETGALRRRLLLNKFDLADGRLLWRVGDQFAIEGLTVRITAARVEDLSDATAKDAKAEGFASWGAMRDWWEKEYGPEITDGNPLTAVLAFEVVI